MQAEILRKSEEEKWGNFVKSHPLATIHQTPEWGHFQHQISERGKYWIVALKEDKRIIGGSLIIRHKLPKGHSWFYSARGPLLDYQSKDIQEQMDILLAKLKPLAKKEKSIFYRIDPPIERKTPFPHLKKFKEVSYGFQPEHTQVLDLTISTEEILKQMKQKGRYNIRLAEKKGVEIIKCNNSDPEQLCKYVDEFYRILAETTKRDGFSPHKESYYKKFLENLQKSATLYLARHTNKTLAGIIVTYFNDTATYYFGASSNEYRNLMAPYLLHWQAINDAKQKGFKYYDFFGISPANDKNHPWQGVTQFKKKFGGSLLSYHPAREHSFKPLIHLLYKIYKKLHR